MWKEKHRICLQSIRTLGVSGGGARNGSQHQETPTVHDAFVPVKCDYRQVTQEDFWEEFYTVCFLKTFFARSLARVACIDVGYVLQVSGV